MIQGFRKFIDLPPSELPLILELEQRFRSRRLRWCREIWHRAGPNRDQTVWRLGVYIRDLPFARDEWRRMELQGKTKGAA